MFWKFILIVATCFLMMKPAAVPVWTSVIAVGAKAIIVVITIFLIAMIWKHYFSEN